MAIPITGAQIHSSHAVAHRNRTQLPQLGHRAIRQLRAWLKGRRVSPTHDTSAATEEGVKLTAAAYLQPASILSRSLIIQDAPRDGTINRGRGGC